MMKEMSYVFEKKNIQMKSESYGERGSKFLVKIPSVGHLDTTN